MGTAATPWNPTSRIKERCKGDEQEEKPSQKTVQTKSKPIKRTT
jgi:hypothetical protein